MVVFSLSGATWAPALVSQSPRLNLWPAAQVRRLTSVICLIPPLLVVAPSVVSSLDPLGFCGVFGPGCPLWIPTHHLPEQQPPLLLWTQPAGQWDLLATRPAALRQPATPPTCSPLPSETRRRNKFWFNLDPSRGLVRLCGWVTDWYSLNDPFMITHQCREEGHKQSCKYESTLPELHQSLVIFI